MGLTGAATGSGFPSLLPGRAIRACCHGSLLGAAAPAGAAAVPRSWLASVSGATTSGAPPRAPMEAGLTSGAHTPRTAHSGANARPSTTTLTGPSACVTRKNAGSITVAGAPIAPARWSVSRPALTSTGAFGQGSEHARVTRVSAAVGAVWGASWAATGAATRAAAVSAAAPLGVQAHARRRPFERSCLSHIPSFYRSVGSRRDVGVGTWRPPPCRTR